MRRSLFRPLFRTFLAVVILLLAVGFWQRDRLVRLYAAVSLFHADKIVGNFTAMEELFLTTPLPLGEGPPTPLPDGPALTPPAGMTEWLVEADVTGIVVLKDGSVRFEAYPLSDPSRTDDPARRTRISWSIAKSYLSVLAGVLVEEGAIESLDDPVTKYAPELAGTAYDGNTVRTVLQMSSGVVFDEDYLDFWSDINKMGRVLALGTSMDGFAAALTETEAPPGERWKYVSIDTHIVAMVLRGATGRSLPDLMTEKVLQPLGMRTPARFVTDGRGVAFALGGLMITTRDYALFGQMVASGGMVADRRIVSEDWIIESTAASARTEPGRVGYGYQWWIPVGATPGEVMGRGIYGQYLYIDLPRGVVIAVNAADREFREAGVNTANVAMMRKIAEALN